jgi:hypothetical protein
MVANGYTSLPVALQKLGEKADGVLTMALGERFANSNPLRQTLTTYEHASGIEGGYGFFAPAIPNSYKLVFQLTYSDGGVEYELPRVRSEAAGLRLSGLFDQIAIVRYAALRELMLKMLAYSAWQLHPEATKIRAVFGEIRMPSVVEAKRGEKETYRFMYAYDFSFATEAGEMQSR